MIELPCSQCGETLLAEDEWVGKKVKCPDCGARSLVGSPAGEAVTLSARPARRGRNGHAAAEPSEPRASAREATAVAGYEILGGQ